MLTGILLPEYTFKTSKIYLNVVKGNIVTTSETNVETLINDYADYEVISANIRNILEPIPERLNKIKASNGITELVISLNEY